MARTTYQAKRLQIYFPLTSGLRINTRFENIVLKNTQRHFCSKAGNKLSSQENSTVKRWSPWLWYNTLLHKRPLVTKCITSGVMYGLGDVIAQKMGSGKNTKFNKHRIFRGIVYGSMIAAPLGHLHFNFLEWLVVKKAGVRLVLVPFVKVFLDQFVYWAPTIVCLYHLSMGVMEGLTYDDCVQRLKELYWPTLRTNWMIWFPLMILNYKFIPVAHQLNFCLAVGVVWSTLLSYIRGRITLKHQEREILFEEIQTRIR